MKNKTQIMDLNKYIQYNNNFETCHIPYKKPILVLAGIGVLACLITPATNWMILPIIKLTKRFG